MAGSARCGISTPEEELSLYDLGEGIIKARAMTAALFARLDATMIGAVAIALVVLGMWIEPLSETYLMGVFGSILGAIVGLLCSPYNSWEKALFKGYEKLVWGFLSGWGFTKINSFLSSREQVAALLERPVLIRGMYFLSWFLLATLAIFVYRRYYGR